MQELKPGYEYDWQGKPAPIPTDPSERVLVWEIESKPSPVEYDTIVERSWHSVRHLTLETFLDNLDDDQRREGVTIKVRLIEMRAEDIPRED